MTIRLIKIFFLILASVILFIKCSSSGTIRYGDRNLEKESKDPSVRFTSVDDSMVVDLNLDLKDPSDLPEDEPAVDISDLVNSRMENSGSDVLNSDYGNLKEKMLMEIIKYLDTPYKYGGMDKNGIDCSAFTQLLYKNVFYVQLERSARLQYNQGQIISDKHDLKFGDLVFFNTRRRVKPGHVGIYIGDNLFAHASSSRGVTISSIDLDYYAARYMGARRLPINGLSEMP